MVQRIRRFTLMTWIAVNLFQRRARVKETAKNFGRKIIKFTETASKFKLLIYSLSDTFDEKSLKQ